MDKVQQYPEYFLPGIIDPVFKLLSFLASVRHLLIQLAPKPFCLEEWGLLTWGRGRWLLSSLLYPMQVRSGQIGAKGEMDGISDLETFSSRLLSAMRSNLKHTFSLSLNAWIHFNQITRSSMISNEQMELGLIYRSLVHRSLINNHSKRLVVRQLDL